MQSLYSIQKALHRFHLNKKTQERREDNVYLEKAIPEEFEAYYRIKCEKFVNFWSQGTYELPPRENLYRFYLRHTAHASEKNQKEIYLIKSDEHEIAGYLYMDFSEHSVDIPIALSERFTGKGFARQAIQTGLRLAKARGYRRSEVEIREDNASSIRLYTSCGYKRGEKTRAFYSSALKQSIDLYAYQITLGKDM